MAEEDYQSQSIHAFVGLDSIASQYHACNALSVWNSYIDADRSAQRSIELTSGITNRLLRAGIAERGDPMQYTDEIEVLDWLYQEMPINSDIRRGFEALPIFLPNVPSEILNRYDAVQHEVLSAGIDTLIIGACGLSPLGLAVALRNPKIDVWDSDLGDIVKYRATAMPATPPNYHIESWDMLLDSQPGFAGRLKNRKKGIVVEGLTFYLIYPQDRLLHDNIKSFLAKNNSHPATIMMDYFVSNGAAGKRDSVPDSANPEWKYFEGLISNVHDSQKAFWRSRGEVAVHLEDQGYRNVRISELSRKDNAHSVFVFER